MPFKKGNLNYSKLNDVWNKGMGFEDFIGKRFNKLVVVEDVGHISGHRHFRCLCDCGKSLIVDGSKLKSNHTKSCGCIRRGASQPKLRKGYGVSSLNRLIDSYKRNAKNKKITFNLSRDAMISLFESSCFYCGCEPSSIISGKNYYGEFIYNGIDRLDNGVGYIEGNVVSCCKECNYKKGSQGYMFFLQWVKKVYENRFSKDGEPKGDIMKMESCRIYNLYKPEISKLEGNKKHGRS